MESKVKIAKYKYLRNIPNLICNIKNMCTGPICRTKLGSYRLHNKYNFQLDTRNTFDASYSNTH